MALEQEALAAAHPALARLALELGDGHGRGDRSGERAVEVTHHGRSFR
jgi:hypothetical protein